MATVRPYVPGEQQDSSLGGTIIPIQTPGASSGDSGYTGDNSQRLSPSNAPGALTPIPRQDFGGVSSALDELSGFQYKGLSGYRGTGDQISPTELAPSVTSRIDEYNSSIQAEQVSVSALARQYDNLIEQLRGQYRLAETEEEKQRLRYMLADIEAQYDAGKQSIKETYELFRGRLESNIGEERQYAQDFAGRAGQVFSNLADESESRIGALSQEMAGQHRGLGLQSAERIANEWTETIRALGPIQTSYLLEAGNSRVAAMSRSLESMAMQQVAQLADLERLKATTTSTAQYRYMEQVEKRINDEIESMRREMTSIMMTKISATQSALEFNARMRDSAASRMVREPDPAARYSGAIEYSRSQGSLLTSPEEFEKQFSAILGGEAPDDTMWYEFLKAGENQARAELAAANRALTDFQTNVVRRAESTVGGGEETNAAIAEQLAFHQKDRLDAYETWRRYSSLLEEITGVR